MSDQEPWPFHYEDGVDEANNGISEGREIPELRQVPKKVNLPPPLTKVEKFHEANRASTTASSAPVASAVPDLVPIVSSTPQNASETPSIPPLTVASQGGIPVPQKIETPAIPELVIVRQGETPPPPPPLETVRLSDFVYLLLGFHVDTDSAYLCKALPAKTVEPWTKTDEVIKAKFLELVQQDFIKLLGSRGMEDWQGRAMNQGIQIVPTDSLDKNLGILLRATAYDDNVYYDESMRALTGADPYPIYHWCLMKYSLLETRRLDLPAMFFRTV